MNWWAVRDSNPRPPARHGTTLRPSTFAGVRRRPRNLRLRPFAVRGCSPPAGVGSPLVSLLERSPACAFGGSSKFVTTWRAPGGQQQGPPVLTCTATPAMMPKTEPHTGTRSFDYRGSAVGRRDTSSTTEVANRGASDRRHRGARGADRGSCRGCCNCFGRRVGHSAPA